MWNARGFTLFEVVLFIALLPLVMLLTTQLLISEIDALFRARVDRNATDTAGAILERITQEVRLAESVLTASSTFDTDNGRLVLQSFSSPTSTNSAIVDISLLNNDATIQRDQNATTTLTGEDVRVTQLLFSHVTSSISELIRVSITVEAGAGRFLREKQLTTAAILRGSYE